MVESQFHFDPDTYLAMIRREIPDYDTLQAEIGRAAREWSGSHAPRVLDLGAGTGSTSQAVLAEHANARLVLVDENPGMVEVARSVLPAANVERVVIADLSEPVPDGTFDLVVSALAIHHLDSAAKRALFVDVHGHLAADGVFALADVVVPDDPADVVIDLTPGYDKPDRADDLLAWLCATGFRAERTWSSTPDLAVFVARK